MVRTLLLASASFALAMAPTAATAASTGFNLRLTVGVHCSVKHLPTGYGAVIGGAVSLGQFREYCNAPAGYELIVSYTPGTLRGVRITAGTDEVVLTGSGRAVLSRATGPRVRERLITASPGQEGFNAERLELQINPM